MKAELLEIHSNEDKTVLANFLHNAPFESYYLGGYVDFSTKRWIWEGSRLPITTFDWDVNQPQFADTPGIVISASQETKKWKTFMDPYYMTAAFICSKPQCPTDFEPVGNACYQVQKSKNLTLL